MRMVQKTIQILVVCSKVTSIDVVYTEITKHALQMFLHLFCKTPVDQLEAISQNRAWVQIFGSPDPQIRREALNTVSNASKSFSQDRMLVLFALFESELPPRLEFTYRSKEFFDLAASILNTLEYEEGAMRTRFGEYCKLLIAHPVIEVR